MYLLDGLADATGVPGETPDDDFPIGLAQLSMRRWFSNGQQPPGATSELLGTASFEVIPSSALGGTVTNMVSFGFRHWAVIDVPFEYGVPVALQSTFRIRALTDNDLIRAEFNPYRELWGGGVVESVYIDASSTAQLVAIVNEQHPDATVTGVSVDYSPLVTAPEPSAQALAAAALATAVAGTLVRRNRRAAC